MFSFVAVIFVCSSSGLVCQETITYTKHIENFAQQSDIFAAVKAACEQTILYAENTENFVQQSELVAAVGAICEQTIPYAEHTENSVPYPDFLLQSFLHFERF